MGAGGGETEHGKRQRVARGIANDIGGGDIVDIVLLFVEERSGSITET